MNKSIERFAIKNLIAFAVVVIIIVALLSDIVTSYYSDVINLFFSPFEFNLHQAIAEEPLVVLDIGNDINDGDILQKAFEKARLNEPVNVKIEQGLLFGQKFNQSGKYIFKIKPDAIYDLGLAYETTLYIDNMAMSNAMTHKYVLCQLDDALFFTKIPYNAIVSTGDTLKGVFVPFPEATINDIKEAFSGYSALKGLFIYQFDTTLDFLWERIIYFVCSIICIAVILRLVIGLIAQIMHCDKRPLYKMVDLFGGDIPTINKQLETAKRVGKSYITKDWIITPRLFKTQLEVNRKK